MTVPAPVSADLKARFPIFASVPDATVTSALAEAARVVDSSWTDGDFALAQMLYAAHVLTIDGLGTGAEATMLLTLPAGFKKFQAGGSSLERFGAATEGGGVDPSDLDSTSFGQRFKALQRRNVTAVLSTSAYPAAFGLCGPWGRWW